MSVSYKNCSNSNSKTFLRYINKVENVVDEVQNVEEINLTEQDISEIFEILNNSNSSLNDIGNVFLFVEKASNDPQICNIFYQNGFLQITLDWIEKAFFPNEIIDLISMGLIIIKNILNLPITDIITILFVQTSFLDIFRKIIGRYILNPLELLSIIFDIFLALIKPPVNPSFFTDYINFFVMHTSITNITVNSPKAFMVLIKLFEIHQNDLKQILMENDFVYTCFLHINRKTIAFEEACNLLGRIGNFNPYIADKIPDDFYDLISDILEEEDEKYISPILRLCISLSTDQFITDKFISEDGIFKRIISPHNLSFQGQILAIELLSTLMERNTADLENRFIDHGTLDFFVDFLETNDYQIISTALYGITFFLQQFVFNRVGNPIEINKISNIRQVILNSNELINKIHEISLNSEYPEEIHESSCIVYQNCMTALQTITPNE